MLYVLQEWRVYTNQLPAYITSAFQLVVQMQPEKAPQWVVPPTSSYNCLVRKHLNW